MKIVIATDSFKETLSSLEAGKAMEKGLKRALPEAEIRVCPMADGGEGTVPALVDAWSGEYIYTDISGPLGEKVSAGYGISKDKKTAVIEMAEASGIHLTGSSEKNIKKASTYGTGELINHALDKGVRSFVIGIGGSATNDGGAGMLQALGASFTDINGDELTPGGSSLMKLHRIHTKNLDPRIHASSFRVACDVDNPLTGEKGAAAVYGPQKGASPEDVLQLDDALKHFAAVLRKQFFIDIENVPGAGAAGGLGASFLAFFPAVLDKGAVIVAEMTGLKSHLQQADLVITGEGGINHQTTYGKTPVYVASLAKKVKSVPVIALCGSVSPGYEAVFESGIDAVFSTLSEIVSLEELKKVSAVHIEQTAENVGRLMKSTGKTFI